MIALLHCVIRDQAPLPLEFGGAALLAMAGGGLTLIYSELADAPDLPMPESALAFHRVQQEILRERDLVPFRFPTLLEGAELAPHLASFAEQYSTALDRAAGCVQMEIEIETPPEQAQTAASGTAYLRTKAMRNYALRSMGEAVRAIMSPPVIGWRTRATANGQRFFALTRRTELAQFQEKLAQCVMQGASLRVTGPWPATEFMELEKLLMHENAPGQAKS